MTHNAQVYVVFMQTSENGYLVDSIHTTEFAAIQRMNTLASRIALPVEVNVYPLNTALNVH